MSTSATRRHRLAGGVVEVRGEGPTATLLERHLGAPVAPDPTGEVFVRIDLVDAVDDAGEGLRVRSRRGDAVVCDDAPVRVRWSRRASSVRPLLAAAHLAARRRGGLLVHGVVFGWDDGPLVLVTGTSGAGKTGVLLAAMATGATPWAADWSFVECSSGELWPLPQPVRLRPHHLSWASAAEATGPLRAVGLRVAARAGRAVSSRAHCDVALDALDPRRPRPAPPGVLGAVLVLARDDAPGDLSPFTGDSFAGTSSPALTEALAARLEVRVQFGPSVESAAARARQLVA